MTDRAIIKKQEGAERLAVAALPPLDAVPQVATPGACRSILRGAEARLATRPFAVAELEPDFPLPEIEEEAEPEEEIDPISPEQLTVLLAELEAGWQAQMEEACEAARAEGDAAGYARAHAELDADFAAKKADLVEDQQRLKTAWQEYTRKCEQIMAALAFEIAKQLLEAPLPQEVRAVSAQALSQALADFAEAPSVEITLHPDDLDRLQAYGLLDELEAAHTGLRWKADAALAQGDWVAHTPDAAIRRLKAEVLEQLKSRLGLLAAMQRQSD